MRLGRAYDKQDDYEFEGPFRRIATAAAKYFICRRAPTVIFEAMECLGGAGYVEESIFPRLYRLHQPGCFSNNRVKTLRRAEPGAKSQEVVQIEVQIAGEAGVPN